MKPIKNRVFCSDCGRVKMLFPSEEKANNFIAFNAEAMTADGGKAPGRSYFCTACGGWHVTKNLHGEYFEEKEQMKTQLLDVRGHIGRLVQEFNTSYTRKEPEVWKRKLEELKSLAEELDILEPGMLPEKVKIKKCVEQYEYSIVKAEKKQLNRNSTVTPEMAGSMKELKNAAWCLNWGRCTFLACQLNVALGKLTQTADIQERIKAVGDFIQPEKARVLKPLFCQAAALKDSRGLMSLDEQYAAVDDIHRLLDQAEECGISRKHLKGVTEAVREIQKRWPAERKRARVPEMADAENPAAVEEARSKVIEAIDLIKAGQIDRAEEMLQVAAFYLEGYETTTTGQQLERAIGMVSEQVAQYRAGKANN